MIWYIWLPPAMLSFRPVTVTVCGTFQLEASNQIDVVDSEPWVGSPMVRSMVTVPTPIKGTPSSVGSVASATVKDAAPPLCVVVKEVGVTIKPGQNGVHVRDVDRRHRQIVVSGVAAGSGAVDLVVDVAGGDKIVLAGDGDTLGHVPVAGGKGQGRLRQRSFAGAGAAQVDGDRVERLTGQGDAKGGRCAGHRGLDRQSASP